MQTVQSGNTVRVHYHGRLDDGSTFDSSEGREPLEFKAGGGQVIPGFDNAVMDMKPGDKKTVRIPVAEAYGDRRDDMMFSHPRAEFPADITPEEGMELQMGDDQGNVIPVIITEVTDHTVVLDANHPLAGKDLIFDLELVEIIG